MNFLRDNCITMFLAGRDTTAQTASFALSEIAQNPEVKKKLLDELQEIKEINMKNINNMKYLDNVIKETLRLYPIAHTVNRTAAKDATLPSGVKIYKGERIQINIHELHHNPKYWDNPEVFDPSRWDANPIKKMCQYIPFFSGPTVCLGKHLAINETKILVIQALKHFEFELQSVPQVRRGIILLSKNGVKMKLKKRDL